MADQQDSLRIHLSLVSHTNIGKTTLARTLLMRDVGEIADRAHVTETTDDYLLARGQDGSELILWDTPGFGNIDLRELELPSVEAGFRELAPYAGQCRFTGCTHTHEPDCAVKAALQEGKIAQSRYDSSIMIRQELAEQKKRGKKR